MLHALKLRDGRFVVRLYGVDDNPKEARLLGKSLDQPLWTAPLYPVRDSIDEAVTATLECHARGFADGAGECLSLKDSFERADVPAVLPWQEKLSDKVRVVMLLKAIAERTPLDDAVDGLRHGFSPYAKGLLVSEAEAMDLGDLNDFGRASASTGRFRSARTARRGSGSRTCASARSGRRS